MRETQSQLVFAALAAGPATAGKLAEDLDIIVHNVRRILGIAAKAGQVERLAPGVYGLRSANGSTVYVQNADALTSLPKLAGEGLKVDLVFLDIPYKTPALVGGNRGVKDYHFITPEQFASMVRSLKAMVRTPDAPVYHMFSQAPSGMEAMNRYNRVLADHGFKHLASGNWHKTFKDGTPVTTCRGGLAAPEGISLYNLSGVLPELPDLEFTYVRPPVTGAGGRQNQKPVELFLRLLRHHVQHLGERARAFLSLDPFAGTGGLARASQLLGVSNLSIELDASVVSKFILPKLT